MKPSLFKQVSATAIHGPELKPSPRHWNCGLLQYSGKLWMCYRYHLREAGGRCATAIVELDPVTLAPHGSSQYLKLEGPTGTEHHEDARLFMFKGEPHLSFTEMRGYQPGVSYTCVIRYARLKLRGNRWQVCETYQPRWAQNDGTGKEKNWVFFDCDGLLHAVYATGPRHVVIEIKGERIVRDYIVGGPAWSWGQLRGGTSPVMQSDGTFLSIFHSSLPTEEPPHFVRYYAGAYTFEAKPPFLPVRISSRPIMAGSEADGHQVDPRYVAGWKPYVVFPCGLVLGEKGKMLVSLGINDWQCAVARLDAEQLFLTRADGSEIEARYFRTTNGSVPIRITDAEQRPKFLDWVVPFGNSIGAAEGYMRCEDPRDAQEVGESMGVAEITSDEYDRAQRSRPAGVFR